MYARKNFLPRPPVANIDKLLMIIAPEPKPDLYLIDKLYIYCILNRIEPILIINKCDICDQAFLDDICQQYYFLKIFVISAKNLINISSLKDYIKSSICVVSGQSAVGKSSLINSLIPNAVQNVQELSHKINRGKHTTRVNEIFLYEDLKIADTPGFSSLDLNIEYKELYKYFPEFLDYIDKCKYLNCSHIKEGNVCGVYNAVNENKINRSRYDRFVYLYNKLKEEWEKKYD